MKKVLYVPNLSENLFSIGSAVEIGVNTRVAS